MSSGKRQGNSSNIIGEILKKNQEDFSIQNSKLNFDKTYINSKVTLDKLLLGSLKEHSDS